MDIHKNINGTVVTEYSRSYSTCIWNLPAVFSNEDDKPTQQAASWRTCCKQRGRSVW